MVRRSLLAFALVLVLSGCDIAIWRMDEPSGPTAIDSARDHDGVLRDVVVGREGVEGGAYLFNGTSSVVTVRHAADLNPGGRSFSFGAWVKFTGLPPPETWDILRKGISSSPGGFYKLELYNAGGTARALCHVAGSTGAFNAVGGSNLNDDRWHHLTCSRRAGLVTLTVDGIVWTRVGNPGSVANTSDLTIGAKPTGDDHFAGLIDLAHLTVG